MALVVVVMEMYDDEDKHADYDDDCLDSFIGEGCLHCLHVPLHL